MEDSVQHLACLSKETKLDLAKCSHLFYSTEWDPADQNPDQNFIEGITWSLARDEDTSVRHELAVQLSACDILPMDLAEEIACDIEFVSAPFLYATKAFDDQQMSELVPFLKKQALIVLAKRPDLKDKTIYAITVYCDENAAKSLLGNKMIIIVEATAKKMIERFRNNKNVMDSLAQRLDLPKTILKEITNLVSPMLQRKFQKSTTIKTDIMVTKINASTSDLVCSQINAATPQQIHAIAINYRQRHKCSYVQILDIAKRSNIHFLVSMLALESGEILGNVREILKLKDQQAFINLLRTAGVSKNQVSHLFNFVQAHKSALEI